MNRDWRRLHNKELHSLYRSTNIVRVIKSRRLRWASHVARITQGRSTFTILIAMSIGRKPLGRPRHRWDDTVRMDLIEIGISMRNWVDLALNRDYWGALVNAALNLWAP